MMTTVHEKNFRTAGKAPGKADKVLVMLHGRGASAESILGLAQHLHVRDFALIAPQATGHTWYPYSFMAPEADNEPWLSSAIALLGELLGDLKKQGYSSGQIYLLGFSQGACLALEFAARHAQRFGGVIAFTGGLIGQTIHLDKYRGDFAQTPVFIGTSDPDVHVPVTRIRETEKLYSDMNADITVMVYPGMGHTINQNEIDRVNLLFFAD